jgi:hypothetical protein
MQRNQEIVNEKKRIGEFFGVKNDNDSYTIPLDKKHELEFNLNILYNFIQQCDIYYVKLSELYNLNIKLSMSQMDALLFMIEDDVIKEKEIKDMTFKNFEIYGIAEGLLKAFAEADSTQKLPIKLSYTIKKNTNKFQSIAEQIEKSRVELIQKYGEETEDGGYRVLPENEEKANQEFADLMNLEEEINIHTIDINSLPDDIELTNAQMDAIMFMLVDGEEEV